jgi:hypothetical protein
MRFDNPWSLAWLAPLAGLILLMYVLKLRRTDVEVPSILLWRQVIRDVQANAPFQKLRKSLLLLLQLIVASLLALALARPYIRAYAVGGRHSVLVIDTSASMRATDVSPSRLAAAKRQAHTLVDAMRPGDRMMVLAAFVRPVSATGFTAERAELHRAIDALAAQDTAVDMRAALNLASDLVASRPGAGAGRIDLISDGCFESANGSAGAGRAPLSTVGLGRAQLVYHPIGSGHDNVGITSLDYRRSLTDAGIIQATAVTHNFGSQSRTFTEEVTAGSDLVEAHEVTLAPGAEDTQAFDLREPDSPTVLRVRLDLTDSLAVDNEASLVVRPHRMLRVLTVGKQNLFLESALQVDPNIDLSTAASFSSGAGFDVIVFVDSAPSHLPPGNYLFIHCVSDQAPVSVSGEAEDVAPADWERDHPAMRFVDLTNERFASALRAAPLPWARELAAGDSGTLIAAGERNGARSEFLAASLSQSLLPLHVAFPILISNSVRWLGSGSDESEMGQIATGSPITIPAPAAAERLTVTLPDGTKRDIGVRERGGAAFDETYQAGVYHVRGKGFTYDFAANLASAAASDITPRHNLSVASGPAVAGHRVPDNRELFPLVAALALIVLSAEWYVFHRRAYSG